MAFERLIETDLFKRWHRAEVLRRTGQTEKAERVRLDAGFGKNKIRTYDFPDNEIIDHRLKKRYDLKSVLDGKLEPLIADYLRTGRQSGGAV